jgi:hypothetical protein
MAWKEQCCGESDGCVRQNEWYWQCLPKAEIANQQASTGRNITVAYLRTSSNTPVVLTSSKAAPSPSPAAKTSTAAKPSPSPAAKTSTASGTQAVSSARKYPPMPPTKRG